VDDYVDGKFRKVTVKIRTKDGKILKGQVFPKGYVAKKLWLRMGVKSVDCNGRHFISGEERGALTRSEKEVSIAPSRQTGGQLR
jgi:hypothetical protein